MSTCSLYLSLGSNIGDREKNIMTALERLDCAFGRHFSSLSELIVTKSQGFVGEDFLNCAVEYDVEGCNEDRAMEILNICKDVERSLGRCDVPEYDGDGARIYHSRTIDIDIIFFGELRMDTQRLTIPHRDIENRPFVMVPLRQIAKPSLIEAFPEYFDYLCSASE